MAVTTYLTWVYCNPSVRIDFPPLEECTSIVG